MVLNAKVGEIHKVKCLTCNGDTRHEVLASVETSFSNATEVDGYTENNTYQIIRCCGCETISLEENSLSFYVDSGSSFDITDLYPERNIGGWDEKEFKGLPAKLERLYQETISCYDADNLILCAAGVRALVEGLCKEKGITGGDVETEKDGKVFTNKRQTLEGKINGLAEKGLLTKENADILHEHRFLGNTALHNLSEPSAEELELSIEIIEHVFESLYNIPSKAKKLKRIRQRKKKKA